MDHSTKLSFFYFWKKKEKRKLSDWTVVTDITFDTCYNSPTQTPQRFLSKIGLFVLYKTWCFFSISTRSSISFWRTLAGAGVSPMVTNYALVSALLAGPWTLYYYTSLRTLHCRVNVSYIITPVISEQYEIVLHQTCSCR